MCYCSYGFVLKRYFAFVTTFVHHVSVCYYHDGPFFTGSQNALQKVDHCSRPGEAIAFMSPFLIAQTWQHQFEN